MPLETAHGTPGLMAYIRQHPFINERHWQSAVVSHMQSIAALPQLQMLTLSNIFGFSAADFPRPGQLLNLSSLWMTSVPSDLVIYVRIAYKQATTLGLDLSLSKARKPEWLTENLHNPFRDWDGREHISATHARKAALAYKNLRTATQNITSNMDVAALLTAAVTAYSEAFNLIDRRSKAIETVEREEIYSVLFDVLNPLEQKLGEQGASLVNQSRLYQLFDQIRGF